MDQRIIDLYDRFTHGDMIRRDSIHLFMAFVASMVVMTAASPLAAQTIVDEWASVKALLHRN